MASYTILDLYHICINSPAVKGHILTKSFTFLIEAPQLVIGSRHHVLSFKDETHLDVVYISISEVLKSKQPIRIVDYRLPCKHGIFACFPVISKLMYLINTRKTLEMF